MSVGEMILPVEKREIGVNKILGLLAIVCAPMLLAQFFLGVVWKNAAYEKYSPAVAALGVLYIAGWICGAVGMFRRKIYGETKTAKIVFAIQITFLHLALMFSVQETLGISYENGGGWFFFACDMGYPASHLFMIVVGIFTIRAKNWTGFAKYAPFFVGAALPATMATGWLLGMIGGMLLFGALTTIGFATIGIKLFRK